MKKTRFLLFVVGIGLALFGVFSAIKQSNVYWYSYFVIGVFLVCDYIDYQLRKKSLLSLIFDGNLKKFFLLYFLCILFTIIVEIYGRLLGNFWYYPNYDLFDQIIHVFIIGYPFGAFSVIALYGVFRDLSKRLFRHRPDYELSNRLMKKMSIPFIILTIVIFVFLAFYHAHAESIDARLFLLALVLVLGLDAVNFRIHKKAIVSEFLAGNFSVIFPIIITVIVSGLIHEVPNTFSYEWIYQNVPLVSYEIWDVNVLMLIVGWTFLTMGSVVIYNLVVGDEETLLDKFRQRVREV